MMGLCGRATPRAVRHWGFASLSLALLLGCDTPVASEGELTAIEFSGIPFPAVIVGDTLRDSFGVATPLQATAYDGRGAVIAGVDFRFLSPDTGVTIGATGFLTTTRASGTIRVFASLGTLQSARRTIVVTPRPDTVSAMGSTRLTLDYVLPDGAANLTSDIGVSVRNLSGPTATPGNVVGWPVRWQLIYRGDTLSPGDTTIAVLQSNAGRRGVVDTTSTSGMSIRRLRVFSNRLPVATDSFQVVAEVRRHGRPVAGSPIRYWVRITPKS
ncbi:MAG: hypothetical protein FJ362_02150 [Gemmatimonadetes bacterium]|nr:hypothetical protein [Gemmatimonadota bacterium]